MGRALIIAVVLLAGVGTATSDEQAWVPGRVWMHVNWNCEVTHVDGLTIELDVFHSATPNVTGTRFRVVPDESAGVVYLGETIHVASFQGNTQDGLFACYGTCLPGPIHVATVRYMLTEPSEPCSAIRIRPFPGADGPEALGCRGEVGLATTSRFVFAGPYDFCGRCSAELTYSGTPTEGLSCMTVPVEATTWGAIKSLYE